ncbi:endolytic transglycosylase MltG, partial [Patulibacter brassicae]
CGRRTSAAAHPQPLLQQDRRRARVLVRAAAGLLRHARCSRRDGSAKQERAPQRAAAQQERAAAAQRPPATRSERQEIRLAKRRAKIQRRTGTAPGPGGGPATVLGPRTAPARRGVSRLAAFLVLVPILVAIVVGVVLFQPLKGGGEGRVVVTIPPGSSVDDIGRLLHENGVVSNATFFAVRARLSGAAGDLRAGRLELRRDMSYGAAIDALQQDPLPPATVNVTVPEGLSRREAARVAREAGVRGSYLSASASSPGFDPHDYGQPRSRSGLEGFLFPATFELTRGNATARRLVDEQIGAFRRNIRGISWKRARRANLNRYDVLIIASLIEREVRVPSERRLVAAVIYNRLKEGTPLYIDATIRYAERNWTRPLRQSELRRPGPYNTRLRKGLPPTPIGSPGRAAIVAAANPARTDATYYVVRPCGKGRHNFSSSAEQFNRDAAFYESERKRLGRDPSDATNCRKR